MGGKVSGIAKAFGVPALALVNAYHWVVGLFEPAPVLKQCSACGGSTVTPGTRDKCPVCDGKGEVPLH